MSALNIYLDEILKEKGLRRLDRLRALRWYIKASNEEELVKIIWRINDMTKLKILWEAGLTAALQEVVTRKTRQLTEARQ